MMNKQRNVSLLLIVALIFSLVQVPVNAELDNHDEDSDVVRELEEDLETDIKDEDELDKSTKKSDGRIVYVDIDGKDAGEGESWDSAYNNLEDAVSKLNTSDDIEELWIRKGEYELPSEGLKILKNVKIFGGLEGNETEPGNVDSWDTILKGSIIVGDEDGVKPDFIELNNISITGADLALEAYDANISINNVHIYGNERVLEISNSTEDSKNLIKIKNSKINNNDELYLILDNGTTDIDILDSEFENIDDVYLEGMDMNIEDSKFDSVCRLTVDINDKKDGQINISNIDFINGESIELDGYNEFEDARLNISGLSYEDNIDGVSVHGFEKAYVSNSIFKDNKFDSEVIDFGGAKTDLKNLVFENNSYNLLSLDNSSRIEGLKIINTSDDEVDSLGLSINSNNENESYYIKDVSIENKASIAGGSLITLHLNAKPESLLIEDIYLNNTGDREGAAITIHSPEDMDKLDIKNIHVKEDKEIKRGPIISLHDNGDSRFELDLIQMNIYETSARNLLELYGDVRVNIINSTVHNNIFEKLIETALDDWYEENPVEIKNSILYKNDLVVEEYTEENILDTKYINSLVENSKVSGEKWDETIGVDGGENIDLDPLFINERGQIDEKSPAVDKGNKGLVDWDKDILGNDRIWGENVDLGAFEYFKEKVEEPEVPEVPEDPGEGIIVPPVKPEKPEEPKEPEFPILDKVNHFAYLEGYEDGTIRPEDNISREAVSAVFFRLLDKDYRETIRSESNDFKDVKTDRWSNKHISTLTRGNILEGYENGEFRPANSITRAELATIIKRFSKEKGKKKMDFNDIGGHWAEEDIKVAASQGWIEGYEDGSFRPDKYMTRAEFTTLINRVLEREPKLENILEDRKEFKDVKEGKWYYVPMIEASNGHKYKEINGNKVWTELKDFDIEM